MFKTGTNNFSYHNFYITRCLSQKVKSEIIESNANKNDPSSISLPPSSLSSKPKFDPSLIPKEARDNFLIRFNKKIPTYDQLFEYNVNLKLYNKFRFINESRFLSVDFKSKITRKYELSRTEFRNFLRRLAHNVELKDQTYQVRRHGILGPDLAAALFILSRGGKVRYKHDPNYWVVGTKTFPQIYDKKYRVISIDASGLNLMYEGLDNLILLNNLEELNLSGNEKLDDWACDKIARLFRNSECLSYLNLSDLPNVSHRGIEALHKINSLKTLVIRNTKASNYPFIELLILMFNEINPQCRIIYE